MFDPLILQPPDPRFNQELRMADTYPQKDRPELRPEKNTFGKKPQGQPTTKKP